MNIVYRKIDGTVIFSMNSDSARFDLPVNIKKSFFTMLSKKEATLTITYVKDTTKMHCFKCNDNAEIALSINCFGNYFAKNHLQIKFSYCYDIAGQIHIENYIGVKVIFYNIKVIFYNYSRVVVPHECITEFPVLDKTVRDLEIICNPYYIGEDCKYFDDLPDLYSLVVTSDAQIDYRFCNLPLSLRCLYIYCNEMKYPIEPLPVNLVCFKLECRNYNFLIDLPPNVQHYEIYSAEYTHGIANIPDSVLILGISYWSIKDFEKLPKNCGILVYRACPKELYYDLSERYLGVIITIYDCKEKIHDSKINHNCCICVGF